MTTGARPRSVLLVTDALEPGGLERIVVGIAGGLLAAGHRVGVHAAVGGALWDELPRGVERYRSAGRPTLRTLRRLLRSGRFDVVHSHQRGVTLLARLAASGLRVPVVEHVHNVFAPSPLARLLSFRGSLLLACGTAVHRMLVEEFGRPAERVRLVPNGVSDHLGAPPPPLPSTLRPGTLRLIGIGRLTEQKDPVRFVRVVAAMRALLPDADLQATWVGDGPLLDEMRAAVEHSGLGEVLLLPGHRDDVRPFLVHADALLLTSRWEGLPLVALEALATGRGLLLPDVGSCADALGSDGPGLLYDPTLADTEVAAVLVAALTPEACAKWSRAARQRFEQHFTFDRMLRQVLDVYEEVAPTAGSRWTAASRASGRVT